MDYPTIGIIGLGAIGGGMAASVARAGMESLGFDIDENANRRAADHGVTIAGAPGELARRSNIIVSSLASVAAIRATWLAEDGVLAHARPGTASLECSTVAPELAREITAAASGQGLRHMEASVVGLGSDALEARLYYYLSGERDNIDTIQPFLSATGRGQAYLGTSGAASVAKVLNNSIGYATIVAIGEALAVARRNGIDLDQFVEVVIEGRGAGHSVVFDRHAARMAHYPDHDTGPNPIGLKDANALADILAATGGDHAVLQAMIDTYRTILPDAVNDTPIEVARYAERDADAKKDSA